MKNSVTKNRIINFKISALALAMFILAFCSRDRVSELPTKTQSLEASSVNSSSNSNLRRDLGSGVFFKQLSSIALTNELYNGRDFKYVLEDLSTKGAIPENFKVHAISSIIGKTSEDIYNEAIARISKINLLEMNYDDNILTNQEAQAIFDGVVVYSRSKRLSGDCAVALLGATFSVIGMAGSIISGNPFFAAISFGSIVLSARSVEKDCGVFQEKALDLVNSKNIDLNDLKYFEEDVRSEIEKAKQAYKTNNKEKDKVIDEKELIKYKEYNVDIEGYVYKYKGNNLYQRTLERVSREKIPYKLDYAYIYLEESGLYKREEIRHELSDVYKLLK